MYLHRAAVLISCKTVQSIFQYADQFKKIERYGSRYSRPLRRKHPSTSTCSCCVRLRDLNVSPTPVGTAPQTYSGEAASDRSKAVGSLIYQPTNTRARAVARPPHAFSTSGT